MTDDTLCQRSLIVWVQIRRCCIISVQESVGHEKCDAIAMYSYLAASRLHGCVVTVSESVIAIPATLELDGRFGASPGAGVAPGES